MQHQIVQSQGALIINLSGKCGFNDYDIFKDAISAIDEGGLKSVSMDVSQLSYIDSSGIGMLLLVREHCQKQHISASIVGMHGHVEKVLRLTKLDQLFHMN